MGIRVDKLGESFGGSAKKYGEGFFSAITVGFFFLLIGVIFVSTPNLFEKTLDFFRDFDVVQVPNTGISTVAPIFPRVHQVVYTAAEQFSFALGLFRLVILALRFIARSPWSRKAETASNFVFWISAGYLIRTLLIETTRWSGTTTWFVFWSAIIMLLGLSFIVRAVIPSAASAARAM